MTEARKQQLQDGDYEKCRCNRYYLGYVMLCSLPLLIAWLAYPKVVDKVNFERTLNSTFRVEEWQRRNTFQHGDFSVEQLLSLKKQQNLTVSVILPARDERDTVGPLVTMLRSTLMSPTENGVLIDQLLVIDSDSSDNTSAVALEAGATVAKKSEVLPVVGDYPGKGETLWKSLAVATGDIIVWLDADVTESGPHFVTGLLGPLLTNDHIVYVKAFYKRPLIRGGSVLEGEGGRVTELSVKPLLKHLYPHLTGFHQPLAGEYAIRRKEALELPFFINYGVEMGLLIDISRRCGMDRIAQVNLNSRIHKNRGLSHLSTMANQVVAVMMKRAGMISEDLTSHLATEREPMNIFINYGTKNDS